MVRIRLIDLKSITSFRPYRDYLLVLTEIVTWDKVAAPHFIPLVFTARFNLLNLNSCDLNLTKVRLEVF